MADDRREPEGGDFASDVSRVDSGAPSATRRSAPKPPGLRWANEHQPAPTTHNRHPGGGAAGPPAQWQRPGQWPPGPSGRRVTGRGSGRVSGRRRRCRPRPGLRTGPADAALGLAHSRPGRRGPGTRILRRLLGRCEWSGLAKSDRGLRRAVLMADRGGPLGIRQGTARAVRPGSARSVPSSIARPAHPVARRQNLAPHLSARSGCWASGGPGAAGLGDRRPRRLQAQFDGGAAVDPPRAPESGRGAWTHRGRHGPGRSTSSRRLAGLRRTFSASPRRRATGFRAGPRFSGGPVALVAARRLELGGLHPVTHTRVPGHLLRTGPPSGSQAGGNELGETSCIPATSRPTRRNGRRRRFEPGSVVRSPARGSDE